MSLIRYIPVVSVASILGLSACGSGTEPILIPIPDETREATLVDVDSGSLGDPSAFDIITGEPVRTDQFSGWDFVFQIAGKPGGHVAKELRHATVHPTHRPRSF